MSRLVLPFSLLLAGLACGGGSTPAPGGDAAKGDAPADRRDALVVAVQQDLGNLNPIVYELNTDAFVLNLVTFPPLDSTLDCELKYAPALAESWEWNDAGTEITFKLRDDITYEDGTKVTAQDWAFAYEQIRNPKVASPRLGSLDQMTEDSPVVIDDQTIVFKFTQPYNRITQLGHASLSPMPRHIYEGADMSKLRGHPNSMAPMATGPFRLKLHERNSRYVLEPNPKFTGPETYQPKLNRIVFRIIPEYATRLTELRSGGVDLMDAINIEDVDTLKAENPEIRIVSRGYRTSDYVAWNLADPMFADVNVRKALTMAIDIDGMMSKLITGADGTVYGKASVSTVTPELCREHATDIEPLPYDLEQAKKLLADAGWTDTDGDGVLDKDGEPFRFTLKTNAGNKRRADASILIQANLKKAGIQVDLEKLETNSFYEGLRHREFEAALAGWSASLFIDMTPIWHSDTEDKKYEFNFTSYSNPEVDALMEKALATPDPEEAAPIWAEVQRKIYADQPYTFLWWREELAGIHDRFENTTMDPQSLLSNAWDWSVPADKVKYPR